MATQRTRMVAPDDYEGPMFKVDGGSLRLSNIGLVGNNSTIGVRVEDGYIGVNNAGLFNHATGVEAREGSRGQILNSEVQNKVSDVAYGPNVRISVVNTYAKKLFNLTEGSFSQPESDLNFIAYQLLNTTDPDKTVQILVRLIILLSDHSGKIKWLGPSVAYDVSKDMIEHALGIKLPF